MTLLTGASNAAGHEKNRSRRQSSVSIGIRVLVGDVVDNMRFQGADSG